MIELVKRMVEKSPVRVEEGDYQKDGLWFCGKCHSAKQAHIVIDGIDYFPMAKCKCPEVEIPTFCRPEGVPMEWTFGKDDNPSGSKAARKYCELFPTENGLLFYGGVGSGKSFQAGCICNALALKGYSTIMDTGRGFADRIFADGSALDRFANVDLLVLDDLATERNTEYMSETIYTLVNSRIMRNKPMIVTTNLTADELKNPDNITDSRIYSRILSRCIPILIKGSDRRREQGRKNLEEWRKNFG